MQNRSWITRFLAVAVLFLIALATGVSVHANPAASGKKLFEGVGGFVFRHTPEGVTLVNRVTLVPGQFVNDVMFESFAQRLSWAEQTALRKELTLQVEKIEAEFAAFRKTQGLEPELKAGEIFSAADEEFLKQAARELGNTKIQSLLTEFLITVKADVSLVPGVTTARRHGTYRGRAAEFTSPNGPSAVSHVDEAAGAPARSVVVELPKGSDIKDLRSLHLSLWQKKQIEARAYRGIVESFILSEGQWKSLFTKYGKSFTADDLARIRKLNRLLAGINDYSLFRLTARTAVNENPAAITQLNDLSKEETVKFLNGKLGMGSDADEAYVVAREKLALENKLQVNKIWFEFERRMLSTFRRARSLGGTENAGTVLQGGSLEKMEALHFQATSQIEKFEAEIVKNLTVMKSKEASVTAAEKLAARQKNLRDVADRDLWLSRRDANIQQLEAGYLEFVQNREFIEIFVNLRKGKLSSEPVHPFDLADSFVVSQAQIDAWEALFERALVNSIDKLVLGEVRLFYKTRAGATRSKIRWLNGMTKKYGDKMFTETEFGKRWVDFSKHHVLAMFKHLLVVAGVGGAGGGTLKVAYDSFEPVLESFWKKVVLPYLNEVEPAPTPTPTPTPSSGSGIR